MSDSFSDVLFEPDPAFAEGWFVDDPLAQGALKHASITVLDMIDEARSEAAKAEPELDDFGPLGIFPASVRTLLTPQLIEKIKLAAVIVGWKLAQSGTPIPPGCIVEELALELIRQEAVDSLELIEASATIVDATKGVYEVCVNGNIVDFFESHAPADHALAANYSVKDQIDGIEVRLAKWFKPFFGSQIGGGVHPYFLDTPRTSRSEDAELSIVEPEPPPEIDRDKKDWFRVCVRTWDDDLLEADEWSRMPVSWLYRVQASNAEQARKAVLEQFPAGAVQHPVVDDDEKVRLDRDDIARISIDVQRVDLDQEFKSGTSFHLVGAFGSQLTNDHLPQLTGHLAAIFPAAVVAADEKSFFFGVNIHAESHEEAEADFEEAISDFCSAVDLEDEPLDGYSSGHGTLNVTDLWREIQIYRQRWHRPHPAGSGS
jgi:hypothetical protein